MKACRGKLGVNLTPRPLDPSERTAVPFNMGGWGCWRGGVDVGEKRDVQIPLAPYNTGRLLLRLEEMW